MTRSRPHRHRLPRRRLLTAVATVTVLVTSCSGHSAPTATPRQASGAAGSSLAGYRNVGAGVLLEAAAAAGTAARVDSSVTSPFPAFTAVSDVFNVKVPAEPSSPVGIVLPLRAPVPAETVPVVFVSSTGTGGWEPLATTVTADGKAVAARTPHLSFFTTLLVPVKDLIGAAKDLFDSATSGIVAEAKDPVCDQEAAARQAGWAVTSKGPDTLKWCFGLDAHGTHQVTVVNNRRYPLDVSHAGATVVHGGPRDLTDDAHGVPVPKGVVLLFPRDEAVFTTTGPARFRTEFDGLAQSVYALQIGYETAIGILAKFGLGKGVPFAEAFGKLISLRHCAGTLGHPDGGEIIKNCFGDPDLLLKAFGAKGLFLAAVMTASGLIQFFHSELNALGDQFNGRDGYLINVTSGAPDRTAPLTLSSVQALASAGTPVDAGELPGYHQIAFTPNSTPSDTELAFSSPSGNVICFIAAGGGAGDVGTFCQAMRHTYRDPPDPGCHDIDWDTGALVMEHSATRDRASFGFCTGGVLTPDTAKVLPYGRSVSFAGVTCSSSERGVACRYAGMALLVASSEAFARRS